MAASDVMGVDRLIDETRELVDAVERGEVERAAWIAIADNLLAIKRAEPTWGNARIGAPFDKSGTWVQRSCAWRTKSDQAPSPFSRKGSEVQPTKDDWAARKVLRDRPEAVADEIAAAVETLPAKDFAKVERATADRAVREFDDEHHVDRRRVGKSDERKAADEIHKAVWAIRSRFEFYADVPLREIDRALLGKLADYIAERVEREREWDEGITDLLEQAEA